MSEEVLDSGSFNKNYRVLKETADWLSKQEEPDIDQLVPKVERAMQAYRICKDRLDKVKETLGHYLQGDNAQTGDGRPEAEAKDRSHRPGCPRRGVTATGTVWHSEADRPGRWPGQGGLERFGHGGVPKTSNVGFPCVHRCGDQFKEPFRGG